MNEIYIERLFPKLDNKNKYKQLQIDEESISFITTPNNAKQIGRIIKKYFDNNNIDLNSIIDCTACVGGDTITFSKLFNKVISVEIDKDRFNMLENNINIYKLDNIISHNDDCLSVLKKYENIQAVYFDPPWGGSDYKIHKKLKLFINDISIEKITIDLILKKYNKIPPKFIIFKLPKNYDLLYFYENISSLKKEINIYLHEFKKINLIIVENLFTINEFIILE